MTTRLTFTADELKTILDAHKLWRKSGGSEGSRANLAGADLAGANLAGANLAGADLADANLARAYLAGANLARAYLAGANLAGACLAGANLAGAYLAGAYLADANLARANLARANLADAYLADANLARADLEDANLADADLADANLADANLADANLAGANLAGANLAGANLADANLADAYLAGANLAGALNVPSGVEKEDPPTTYVKANAENWAEIAKHFRLRNPEVPVVENLDARILDAVTIGGGKLEMSSVHVCETTHCRAGWAVTLAGKAGLDLEAELGWQRAASMIYRASTGRVPHFYATNERALEDIKACAEVQAKAL